ncbi:acyl-CoA-like ligand-binding transcription factor [Blastococcus sp. VKM Ac-2987]|uniref:acyl-CoA-like ligand-binding transcription factor n=1 Tax=Blastococcus sp. VKM Ac-2987 TaxID=3004141 RepID=UPI0022AB9AD2|nr:TetR family transcriptional regulator [Blastococcus sp. VKM Ac-2987]MCZ2860368.1 TetR family transcriptional regulator [Blastococcus sp. VKM Ac-2987]
MTGPGLRARKKQDTRAALAAATLELAAEHGLAAVTVEQIAARAGVSYRTFFNYFSGKEEALLRPGGAGPGTFGPRLLGQDPALPVLAAARAALHEELAVLESDRAAWQLRLTLIADDEALLPRLVELGATGEREMTAAVAARTGQDAERDLYPALVGAVLGCAVRVTLARWHRLEGRAPLPRLLDEALDALAAGLPDPASPS